MDNIIADHFSRILFDDRAHCPSQFEIDLRTAIKDPNYEYSDFVFDMRTGIEELTGEFDQDISSNKEERETQIFCAYEKIKICHKLNLRESVILIALSNTVFPTSQLRQELINNPEIIVKRLASNTSRLGTGNFTHVGTDVMHLSLIDTFPKEVLEKAALPDKYLKLLFKLTNRPHYIELLDNVAKRNMLSDSLGM